MSPDTLDLLQTLNGENEEERYIVPNVLDNEQETDFSADTDSDYVPDSEENSDSENLTLKSKKFKVVGVVHNNKDNQEICEISRKALYDIRPCNNNSFLNSITNIDTDEAAESNIVEEIEMYSDQNKNSITNTDTVEAAESNIVEEVEMHSDKNSPEIPRGRPRRGRKRLHKDHTIIQRKERKYANLPYHNNKKLIEPKIFKDYVCHCKKKCFNLIGKEKRQEEFEKYINLGSYEAQLLYIVNYVSERPKKRSYSSNDKNTDKHNPKQFSRIYTVGGTQVCREMFVNNFQITPKKVDECLKKFRKGMIKDGRGQTGGQNKTTEEDIDFIKKVIDSLPKYESHYRRETNNGCQYLKLGTTVPKIYELYVEQYKNAYGVSKKPASIGTLKSIFHKFFNLRCKTLKKDTCNKCDTLHIKLANATETEAAKFQREKQEHLERAETLRKTMNEDLKKATTDESFECLTYDMEKTLPLPRIPTSIVFYKRQLWLYNCGIHAGSTDNGYCYVWLEGEAGRGAQEVGSCLINYIKHKMGPKEHLVLWSDCCGGQNRNIKMVLMMKSVLSSHATLKTIKLKYLESGHTFLPNDTDFSKIESQLKYHDRIYTAEEYLNVIKSCKKKKPLEVYKMKTNDFLSTNKIEKKIVNRKICVTKNKVNWLKTKEILIEKEKPYSIFMKTTESEEFQELNIEKRVKGKSLEILEEDLTLLWPNGKEIPQAKLDDLKSMFDLIPKDCLPFYKSLKGNENIMDDVDGYGDRIDFPIEDENDD